MPALRGTKSKKEIQPEQIEKDKMKEKGVGGIKKFTGSNCG